jgi:hypothetical protein
MSFIAADKMDVLPDRDLPIYRRTTMVDSEVS